MNRVRRAAADGGIILAVVLVAVVVIALWAILHSAPKAAQTLDVGQTNKVVQELAEAPPLATAYDICQDPNSRFARFPIDQHYEADLVQNAGQLNQVHYHLFFRGDRRLSVVIEETRAGQQPITRTDPNTDQFWDCVNTKKVEEVRPAQ